ncbi:MAG TPA: hypothetical protein VIV06_10020 [Candidatus Limnocylindrales bacterium]
MSEYGQIVGNGTQVAGGGGAGQAAGSSGVHMGDPVGAFNDLLHGASTAVAGLPPAVLAVLIVVVAILLLAILRRAF